MDFKDLDTAQDYGSKSMAIPDARDEEIALILRTAVSENLVSQLVHELTPHRGAVLRAFGERMATAAVRNQDPELLKLGLIAFLIPGAGPDVRDVLVVMPVFYDAMRRLGVDSESFVNAVRSVVGDLLVNCFEKFLERPEEMKTLKIMAYVAGNDEDGFRYIREW
jgi:hypothetical protein